MMTKFTLSFIFLKSSLKVKVIRFLSNILRASAITIEGMKITFSPCSHFSKISDAFELILGLLTNHQRRACVSVTKFMGNLNPYFGVERFLYGSNVLIGNIYAFKNTLELDNLFPGGSKFLE